MKRIFMIQSVLDLNVTSTNDSEMLRLWMLRLWSPIILFWRFASNWTRALSMLDKSEIGYF